MNIVPEKIKIGWRNYSTNEGEHRTADDGKTLYGEILPSKNSIFLYDKLEQDEKNVTYLHEMFHGLFFAAGQLTYFEDENLICCLAENFYQILKDNPELFKDR